MGIIRNFEGKKKGGRCFEKKNACRRGRSNFQHASPFARDK